MVSENGELVPHEALYKSLSEDGNPRLTTFLGVAHALGVTLSGHISREGPKI